jgi:dTMP kinase
LQLKALTRHAQFLVVVAILVDVHAVIITDSDTLFMSFFISFEGIDGCGKTTQVELLRAHLESREARVLTTREPGGTALAEAIRNYLLTSREPLASRTELLLFAAARAQHVEEAMRPALVRNEIVLCDRFVDSTTAYQGAGLGLDATFIAQLNAFATDGLLPQVTFLLDIDPLVGLRRRAEQRGESQDRIEERGIQFQCRVRDGFAEAAQQNPERIVVLDASKPAKIIHNRIVRVLEERGLFHF